MSRIKASCISSVCFLRSFVLRLSRLSALSYFNNPTPFLLCDLFVVHPCPLTMPVLYWKGKGVYHMGTWGELSHFRYDELAEMDLTWDDLSHLTLEQLLMLAEAKVKRYRPEEEKYKDLKELLLSVIAQISACFIIDAAQAVNWSDVLKQIVQLVQKNP